MEKALEPIEVEARIRNLGLTQPDFGTLLGVSKVTVNRWCRGTAPIGGFVGEYLDGLDDYFVGVVAGVLLAAEELPPNMAAVLFAHPDGKRFAAEFPSAADIFIRGDADDAQRLDIAAKVHSVALASAAAELRVDGTPVKITMKKV